MTKAKKPAEKTKERKLDPEKYNQVARNSDIKYIQLISNAFDVQPSFFSEYNKVKLDLCHSVLDCEHYKDQNVVTGIFRFELIAKLSRKHVLSCHADFMTVYEVPDDSPDIETRAFCKRVGVFAAYPYFRALFAHLTSLANVEIPSLPVLSADPLRRDKGKQTKRISTD